jgi:hypothetical protein
MADIADMYGSGAISDRDAAMAGRVRPMANGSTMASPNEWDAPAPSMSEVQSQVAAMGSADDVENRVLDLRAGAAEFGPRPHWNAEGAFGPRDLFNIGGMAVGGLAGLAGAGARGIASYGARQAAIEGLREPVEQLFQGAARSAPDIGARLARYALGVVPAAVSGVGQAQTTAPPDAKMAPSDWTHRQVAADMTNMSTAEFKKLYGVLPEQALDLIEKRNAKNPPGFFRRLIGGETGFK